jgi:hypothetical protein
VYACSVDWEKAKVGGNNSGMAGFRYWWDKRTEEMSGGGVTG